LSAQGQGNGLGGQGLGVPQANNQGLRRPNDLAPVNNDPSLNTQTISIPADMVGCIM
jgi:hypothetical protein